MEARIMERLGRLGVPLDRRPAGLVDHLRTNVVDLDEVIAALFPTNEDAAELLSHAEYEDLIHKPLTSAIQESMIWLQWLMFMGDPGTAMEQLSEVNAGERGVCGVVWENYAVAYRCRTCEEDPSRAICVECFKDGDHEDHEYYIGQVFAGCCDCGDIAGWKPSGFCSKHKGTEHIQALPRTFAESMGPILNSFFRFWKISLEQYEQNPQQNTEKLTHVAAGVFLELCEQNECILSFISQNLFPVRGLVDILIRLEQLFYGRHSVDKLYNLLLKLFAETTFKFEFAKAFIGYYPTVMDRAIREGSDSTLQRYTFLKKFSVQIFWTSTLPPRLVKETKCLPMLLQCLKNLLISCAGDDGRLIVERWKGSCDTIIQVVEDIRPIIRHSAVPVYATNEMKYITRKWMQILRIVQAMYPQNRNTWVSDKKLDRPFALNYSIAMVHSDLVDGALSNVSSEEVGKDRGGTLSAWLTFECMRTLESWLLLDDSFSQISSSFSTFTRTGEVQGSLTPHHSIGNVDSVKYLGEKAGGSGSDDNSPQTDGGSTHLESMILLNLLEWPNIVYDVTSQNVSVQITLHRLLSMIMQKSLRKSYGESASSAPSEGPSPTTLEGFFSDIFGVCHPYSFSALLLEHPLRIRVLFALVRAGLWREYGHTAMIRDMYHSIRWCEKGSELDVFLMQCCAALAPPDLYVKRILDRFGLSSFINLNHGQSSRYNPRLVQELLLLIIQLLKERRFCGLTTTESLQRELVCKLSVGDATHSELVDSVPQDLSRIGDFKQILDSVAVHYNPANSSQRMYKLRLESWKHLDLYHPSLSLNPKDLQIAEERYFRFCKISALIAQAPTWSYIYRPLSSIARIATCKTVLHIVRSTLHHAIFPEESLASRASEGVIVTALHLLFLALSTQASGQSFRDTGEVIPMLELADEEVSSSKQSLKTLLVCLMRKYQKENNESFAEAIYSLCYKILLKFEELDPNSSFKLETIAPEVVHECNTNLDVMISDPVKATAQKRQAAIMEKMRAQQSNFLKSIKSTVGSEVMDEIECSLCHDTDSSSPVCFFIHLQKSRLLSFSDRAPVSWEFSSPFKLDYLSPTAQLMWDQLFPRNSAVCTPVPSESSHLDLENLVKSAVDSLASDSQPHEINALLGFINIHFPSVTNIDFPVISEDAIVKTSSIENLEEHFYSLVQEKMHSTSLQKDFQKCSDAGGSQQSSSRSFLLSKYIGSIVKDITKGSSKLENLHAQSSNSHAYDGFGPVDCDGIHLSSCGHAAHQECLERYLSTLVGRYSGGPPFPGSEITNPNKGEFLCPMCREFSNSIIPSRAEKARPPPVFSDSGNFSAASLRIQEAFCLMESAALIAADKDLSLQQLERQKSNLEPLTDALCSLYFPSERVTEVSQPVLLWDVLKYLIASTEVSARTGNLLSTPTPTLLPLLLDIAQGSRTESVPTTYLRFRGIQLSMESVCLGSSNAEQNQTEGNLLCLLERSNSQAGLDIQLWERASAPVLAHDPFSSLMWALFCLPAPFLSCKKSFFSLVHIFYLVAVTQAIVIACRKGCIISEESLITDICAKTRNHQTLTQYLDSNHIDSSQEYKDAIQNLSCTFLRRCALLWDLITASSSSFSHQLDLEVMFSIPPIDVLINDGMARLMASRWLDHFKLVQKVLYCTPPVPLNLVKLPDLYDEWVECSGSLILIFAFLDNFNFICKS